MLQKEPSYRLLQSVEEQYKVFIDSVKDYAIFMLDNNGIVVSWNKGAERLHGYSEHEIIGKHFSLFYSKEDIEKNCPESDINTVISKGKLEQEGWKVRKDKSLFWVNTIISPVYDYEDQLEGYSFIVKDLTEKRSNEFKNKEIEQQYSILANGVDSIKDYAIIVLDENGYVSSWNSGAERIKGYSSAEILGKHFSNFYPRNAVEAGYPEYELDKAISDGRFEDEGWRVRKDKSLFWANVVITPFYQNNKLTGFIKVTRDLTEKLSNEKKYIDAQSKHKLLLDSIRDYAIFMLDPEGYIISSNSGAENVHGYQHDEIVNKHFSLFYPKNKVEEEYPKYELKQALLHGRFEEQGWRVNKNGSIFWANVIIMPMYQEERLLGFSKITRDITDQKKVEKSLKESEEKYRLLVDSVKDYGIYVLDPFGYVTTWNKGAENIKGYKAEEIIGKHFSIFYDSASVVAGLPDYELARAKETGRFEHEGWRLRKDGTKFWANVIVTPIKTDNERIIGFSKVTRDLTELKKSENDLLRKNAELRKVNNDLDSFIYTASHDLKAPISNIEGLIISLEESLPSSFENDASVKEIIDYINQAISRFKRTIYDLTEITKLQWKIQDKPDDINIIEVFESVKESIAPLINSSNAKITFNNYNGDCIKITHASLRSILYNLISNALKYRHPDRDPEVVLTFKIVNEYYLIKIEDNGLGIPHKNQDKIFTMFKRFHDHVEGTGVGLFIVKRIVDNMEGKIEVESTPDVGTTFSVFLKKELK